jgi:hypothetical protein
MGVARVLFKGLENRVQLRVYTLLDPVVPRPSRVQSLE